MNLLSTTSFASFKGIRRQGPAVSVWRGQNRWFQVDPEVIPQAVGTIDVIVISSAEKVLKSLWLCGIQKTENTPLILTVPTTRNRTQKTSDNWV